jgi:hypothetical protein
LRHLAAYPSRGSAFLPRRGGSVENALLTIIGILFLAVVVVNRSARTD